MLPVSQQTKDAWLSDSSTRRIHIRIYSTAFDWLNIYNEQIVERSFKITQTLSDSDEVSLTGCISSSLEVEIVDQDADFLSEGIPIDVIMKADNTEEIPIFKGYIWEIKKGTYKNGLKLVCFDSLNWIKEDFTDWYSEEPRESVDTLLTKVLEGNSIDRHPTRSGLGSNGTLLADCGQLVTEGKEKYLPKNTTALGIVKSICTVCGRWGFMGRDGQFETKAISQLGEDLITFPYHMKCDMKEYTVIPPDAVISTNDDSLIPTTEEASPKIGGNTDFSHPYIIKGNIIALSWTDRRQTMVTELYNQMQNLSFTPFDATIPSTPYMWVGDKIRLMDENDVPRDFIVFKRVLTLFEDRVTAKGSKFFGEDGEHLNSSGSVSDSQGGIISIKIDTADKMDKLNPIGSGSMSMNRRSGRTVGGHSVAMGNDNVAMGDNSVAIGKSNTSWFGIALGENCTSGGGNPNASCSTLAMGYHTKATNQGSFAEGLWTEATPHGSHASGQRTITKNWNQTVVGRANNDTKDGTNHSLFTVGNGTLSGQSVDATIVSKSNAFWVQDDGIAVAQRDVQIENGKKLSEQPTITPLLTSGTEIADITVGSTTTKLYAPQGGGGYPEWDDVQNKPFVRLGGDFTVDSDMFLYIANFDWSKIGGYVPISWDVEQGFSQWHTFKLNEQGDIEASHTIYYTSADTRPLWKYKTSLEGEIVEDSLALTSDLSAYVSKTELRRIDFSIPVGGTVKITKNVTNDGFRLRITTLGNVATTQGEYLVGGNNNGTNIYITPILASSLLTISKTATNEISIVSTHNARIDVICECGNDPSIYTIS